MTMKRIYAWWEMKKSELVMAIKMYDKYLENARENDLFLDGWTPVCFAEFVENDLDEAIMFEIKRIVEKYGKILLQIDREDEIEICFPVNSVYLGDEFIYFNDKPGKEEMEYALALKPIDILDMSDFFEYDTKVLELNIDKNHPVKVVLR